MSLTLDEPESTDLAEEDIHDVLRNRRRRLVIDTLHELGGPVSVRDLSERIGAAESNQDPPPRNVKQSVYVSLLQTHLPKLDELGIIEYESNGKTVQVADGMADVSVYLETVPKYGLSWSEFYTAVSILGLLTVFGAELGTPIISAIPTTTWAYGFFGLIVISGVYQTVQQGGSIITRLRG